MKKLVNLFLVIFTTTICCTSCCQKKEVPQKSQQEQEIKFWNKTIAGLRVIFTGSKPPSPECYDPGFLKRFHLPPTNTKVQNVIVCESEITKGKPVKILGTVWTGLEPSYKSDARHYRIIELKMLYQGKYINLCRMGYFNNTLPIVTYDPDKIKPCINAWALGGPYLYYRGAPIAGINPEDDDYEDILTIKILANKVNSQIPW